MQGNANFNRVEPPLAPTKTKDNNHILYATIDNHQKAVFHESKNSQVSLIVWPTHVSNAECHKHKSKYMQINEDFLKSKGRYYDLT